MQTIMNSTHCAAGTMVWMVDGFCDRQHWCNWYLELLQVGNCTCHIRKILEPVLDNFDNLHATLQSCLVCAVVRIVRQLRPPHCLAQAFPMMQKWQNCRIAPFATKHATRTGVRHMSTSTGWLDSASTPTVHVYIRFVVVVVHVEQRNIQMLSFPSPVAVAQGRNNRQSRMHA